MNSNDKRNNKDRLIAAAVTALVALLGALYLIFGSLVYDSTLLRMPPEARVATLQEDELFIEPEILEDQTKGEPDAVADDGMWDVTLVKPIHFWHILFRLKYLYNGGIYRIGHVRHARGTKIRIESTPEVSLEADGELLGETPLEFSILPRAIRIVVSKEFVEKREVES